MHTTKHTTLSNGIRIQSIHVPGTQVITTLILAKAGSRYETLDVSGISHFLEHMFFKGSEKYPTPKDVTMAVDSFGGSFNAFTGKEYAGYYIKSNKANFEASSDILADMILTSTLPKEQIEKERGVILEEMAMYLDAPMYQISWDFEKLVFGEQPLGRDQIGTKELVSNVQREQLQKYREQFYTPENLLIVVSGAVEQKHIDRLESLFKDHTGPKPVSPTPYIPDNGTQSIYLRTKNTEQFHISFGCESPAETDPRYTASIVLANILGGNMSSRMFLNIREEKGLCYSLHTRVDEYSDAALLTTQAGVKKDSVLDAIKAIKDEYLKIAEHGISEEELQRSQNYLCGKADLSTEDTEEVAHQFGHNYLLYGSIETFEERKQKYKNVTTEQINSLAKELFTPENFRIAGIGPDIDINKILEILKN